MNILISCSLIILLSSQIGYALDCYACFDKCDDHSVMTCSPDQDVCMTWTFHEVLLKGCGIGSFCSSSGYSCCKSDLCNSAVSPGMSVLLGVTALVVLWVAKVF